MTAVDKAVVYKTAPNFEKKGIAELEQLGVPAFTCWDESGKRAKVTAPGYLFAQRAVQAAFLRHVRGKPLGMAPLADISNLHVLKPAPTPPQAPLKKGDKIKVLYGPGAGMTGAYLEKRGRRHSRVDLGASVGAICVQTASLIRIDPG